MKICGVEIPNGAQCKIRNWPYGLDLSVVARLFIFNNGGYPEIIPITELSSDLQEGEEKLLAEEFFVRLIEKSEATEKDGWSTFAEITSDKFRGTLLFLKFKNRN